MELSSKVLRVMREEGISEQELARMLDSAAITSMRGANRRYFHWLFWWHDNCLLDMQHAEYSEVGNGKDSMLEEHDACQGQGCRKCGWIGQIMRWITDKPMPKHQPLRFR